MKKILPVALAVLMLTPILCSCGAKEEETDLSYEQMTQIDWSQYIDIGEYSSIELDMYPDVTDEDIENEINTLLLSMGETVEVTDRAAEEGDTLDIDFVGTVDGEEFEGGSYSGYSLTLGSGTFIDGFEEGLIGAETDQTVTLNLQFPDPYRNNPDLAGKDVVFTVTVNSITETIYPEFNDAFVAENTDYSTVEEYREGTSRALEEQYHEDMVTYKSSYAYYNVYDNSTFTETYPEGLIEKFYNQYIDYYTQTAEDYDLELSDYLSDYLGATEDDLIAYAEDWSENISKQTILLLRIAQEEGLFITDDETYREEAEAYASEQGFSSVEELEENESVDNIKLDITMTRVLNFITDNVIETGTYADGTISDSDSTQSQNEENASE